MRKRVLKWTLYSILVIFVIGGVTVYALVRSSRQPDAMNMGAMPSMGHGDKTSMRAMPSAEAGQPAVSVTDLVEKQSASPVKTFELTAQESSIDVGQGKPLTAWTYNGTIPGPEIRVQQGDSVVVKLKNRLSEGVTIHWHGVELPNAEDGVAGLTQDAVAPGSEFTYDFIANHPGTYWYHSHQYSSKETKLGLYGTLIVEPKLPTVRYDKDYTAVLHDWDNDIYTINGASGGERFDARPGELVRLRIVNTSSDTHMMTLVGAPFKVVSLDAYDVHEPATLDEVLLPIAASQRYDVEFRMPQTGAVKLVNVDKAGFKGNIFTRLLGLRIPSAAAENAMLTATIGTGEVPADITALQQHPVFDYTGYGTPTGDPDGQELTMATHYDRQFEMTLGNSLGFFNGGFTMRFQINGSTFPNIPSYTVKEGDRVKMHIVNDTDIPHPMHLHGHQFQVLARNGVPLVGSPVYLSTLLVGGHENDDIALVANNPGLWMIHCHNLDHAANGMDMMLNYEGVTTPFTVGNRSGNHPD